MTPWRLLFAHLRNAWFRVLLTAGGVALAVFLLATLRTVVTSLQETVRASGGNRVVVSSAVSLFVFLPSRMEAEIRSMPGVQEVTHWTWFGGVYIDSKNMFGRFATDPDSLRATFGDRSPGQEEIINAVMEGKDTLALLPTGGGKSICFQIPALALEGVTIVVSPLIALMKDQVRQLKERGIIADAIYSGMRRGDIDRVFDNAVYGNTKLLYMSPERLLTDLAR